MHDDDPRPAPAPKPITKEAIKAFIVANPTSPSVEKLLAAKATVDGIMDMIGNEENWQKADSVRQALDQAALTAQIGRGEKLTEKEQSDLEELRALRDIRLSIQFPDRSDRLAHLGERLGLAVEEAIAQKKEGPVVTGHAQ